MESMLVILIAVLTGASCFIARFCPKTVLLLSSIFLGIGVVISLFLSFGPRDYMLHIPQSLLTILHPWVLAAVCVLALVLSISGYLGFCAHKLVSICHRRGSQ